MLNPSTADETDDDPTIRRCIEFAKRDGYGGIHVVNLFAIRATDPKELWNFLDPIGLENDVHIQNTALADGGLPVKLTWITTPRRATRRPWWRKLLDWALRR